MLYLRGRKKTENETEIRTAYKKHSNATAYTLTVLTSSDRKKE